MHYTSLIHSTILFNKPTTTHLNQQFMKLLSLTLALSFSLGQAATITLSTSAFVHDKDDSALTKGTGVVSIGTYSSIPTFSGTPLKTEVLTTYEELAFGTVDSIQDFNGYFNFDLNVTIPNSFNGDDIYLVIGEASSIADSNQFLVWKSTSNPDGNKFIDDNPTGGPGSVQLNNESGDLLLGSFATTFGLAEVSAVPEPSSLALSGLALFALAGRRSRQ